MSMTITTMTTDRVRVADLAGIRSLGTILSIWAHPDDETYLAGGIMAAARAGNQRVVCAAASLGERGTPDPERWPPDRLGQVRRFEAAAAMAVLGVDEHEICGLPDGELTAHAGAGEAWVGRLIDRVRPDTILTFGPEGITGHADHVAVHRWVTSAWQQRGERQRLLFATFSRERIERYGERYERWNMYMTDDRPSGVPADRLAVLVQLDGEMLDRKVAALRAMATQTTELITLLGFDDYVTEVAEETFVDARDC